MKKETKRLLKSIFATSLVAALGVGMVPVQIAQTFDTAIVANAVAEGATAIDSAGHAWYTLDKEGNLVIDGDGEVADKEGAFASNTSIKTVHFTDNVKVKSLRNWFNKCTKLTKVTGQIPDCEKTNLMFAGCTSLETVETFPVISGTDKGLANNMFQDCSKLTSINGGKIELTGTGNIAGMFSGCSKLSLDVVINGDIQTVSPSGIAQPFNNAATAQNAKIVVCFGENATAQAITETEGSVAESTGHVQIHDYVKTSEDGINTYACRVCGDVDKVTYDVTLDDGKPTEYKTGDVIKFKWTDDGLVSELVTDEEPVEEPAPAEEEETVQKVFWAVNGVPVFDKEKFDALKEELVDMALSEKGIIETALSQEDPISDFAIPYVERIFDTFYTADEYTVVVGEEPLDVDCYPAFDVTVKFGDYKVKGFAPENTTWPPFYLLEMSTDGAWFVNDVKVDKLIDEDAAMEMTETIGENLSKFFEDVDTVLADIAPMKERPADDEEVIDKAEMAEYVDNMIVLVKAALKEVNRETGKNVFDVLTNNRTPLLDDYYVLVETDEEDGTTYQALTFSLLEDIVIQWKNLYTVLGNSEWEGDTVTVNAPEGAENGAWFVNGQRIDTLETAEKYAVDENNNLVITVCEDVGTAEWKEFAGEVMSSAKRSNGGKRVSLTGTWALPEGAQVVKAGIARVYKEDSPEGFDNKYVYEKGTKKNSTVKAANGKYSFSLNMTTANAQKTLCSVCYVEYTLNDVTYTDISEICESAPLTTTSVA